ncbi:unnamed protein product, partial [Candidula unifasciata]
MPHLSKASPVPVIVASLAIALTMVLLLSYLCFRCCPTGHNNKPKKSEEPNTDLEARSSPYSEVSVEQSAAADTEVTGTSKESSPVYT